MIKKIKNWIDRLTTKVSFKKFNVSYKYAYDPKQRNDDDDEYNVVHKMLRICPSCGMSDCVLERPGGIITHQSMFNYRSYRTYTYWCVRCEWESKQHQEKLS